MSALHALVALMAALTNADADGRVVVDAAARTVKFVLLNAAAHFGKARSTCQCLCSSWRRGGAGGRSQARAAARALACLSKHAGAGYCAAAYALLVCFPAMRGVTGPAFAHPSGPPAVGGRRRARAAPGRGGGPRGGACVGHAGTGGRAAARAVPGRAAGRCARVRVRARRAAAAPAGARARPRARRARAGPARGAARRAGRAGRAGPPAAQRVPGRAAGAAARGPGRRPWLGVAGPGWALRLRAAV